MAVKVLVTNETPPGGWRVRHPVSGMVFTSHDLGSLVQGFRNHEKANGYTPEDLDALLCEQMGLKEPWCGEPPPQEKQWFGIGYRDLVRGLDFVRKFIASGGRFVDQAEADRRSAICAGCQFNVEHTACLACTGFSAALREVLGDRRATNEGALKSCAVCKCGLKEKVWVDVSQLNNQGLEYPGWCWQSNRETDDRQ